jgi:hypothetical protein
MGKAGWIAPSPIPVLFDIGIWALGLVFVLRAVGNLRTFGFFKTLTGTPFAEWDTWLYSPLCLLLALLGRRVGPIATGVILRILSIVRILRRPTPEICRVSGQSLSGSFSGNSGYPTRISLA